MTAATAAAFSRGNDAPADDDGDCYAVEIAFGLMRAHGRMALRRAEQHRDEAKAIGRFGKADLYSAVCVIIIDRDAVFSRSRAPFRAGAPAGQPIASEAA